MRVIPRKEIEEVDQRKGKEALRVIISELEKLIGKATDFMTLTESPEIVSHFLRVLSKFGKEITGVDKNSKTLSPYIQSLKLEHLVE